MFVLLFRRYFLSLRCFVPSSWPPIFLILPFLRVFSLLRPIVPSSLRSAVVVSLFRFVTRLAVSSLRCFVLSFCFAYLTATQPVAKILRHSEGKLPFLLQIAAVHRSVRHNTDLPPPFHSKMFLQVLSMVFYCLQL